MPKDSVDRALSRIRDRQEAEEQGEAITSFLSSKWTWLLIVGIATAWFILRGLKKAGNKDHFIDGILDTLHPTKKYEVTLGV